MKQRVILKALLGVTVFMVTCILALSFLTKIQTKGEATVKKVLTKYQKRINPYVKLYGITHHDFGTSIQKVVVKNSYADLVLNDVEINQSFVSMSVLWSKLDKLKFSAKNWRLTPKKLYKNNIRGEDLLCEAKSGVCHTSSNHGSLNLKYDFKILRNAIFLSYKIQIDQLKFAHEIISSSKIQIPKILIDGNLKLQKDTASIYSPQNKITLDVSENQSLSFHIGLSKNKSNWSVSVDGEHNSCQAYSKLIHLLDSKHDLLSFNGSLDFSLKLKKQDEKHSVRLTKFKDQCFPLKGSLSLLKIREKFERFKKTKIQKRNWVSYYNISRYFKKSVVLTEDSGFYGHDGVLEQSLVSSLLKNINDKKFTLGGSTITMQTVKNYLLTKKKQISRKLYEVMASKVIESLFTKQQILEYYLNKIEFGPEIYGVKEAASFYFSKAPKQLNGNESAFLASILTNPKVYFKQNYCARKFKPGLNKKIRKVSSGMIAMGMRSTASFSYNDEFFHKTNRDNFCSYARK